MDTIKKTPFLFILIGIGIVAVVVFFFLLLRSGGDSDGGIAVSGESRGVEGEPIDVMLDFYEPWLSAVRSTTTDPYAQDLANSMALSLEMSQKLIDFKSVPREDGLDPVLCQASVPDALRAKSIFEKEDSAQMLVLSKDKQSGYQTGVTLAAHDGLWEITNITCASGEQAPDQGEFSFDREGPLLKNSLKPPLDSQYWHLVFEQDGVFGYTVPLFLNDVSMCVQDGGAEEVCKDDMFFETMRVHVQGQMTEAGVEVKRVEFLK